MTDVNQLLDEIRNPKVSVVSKFHDLDALVKEFFSDGVISGVELGTLDRMDALLTKEFRVAQEYIGKMDKKSPMYESAKYLLEYMYRCRNLIDAAHNKAKVYNELTQDQKKRVDSRHVKKEKLDISGIDHDGMLLMMSLMTPENRMRAQQSFSKQEEEELSGRERSEITNRIIQAINFIHDKKMNARQLNQILQLGYTHER